MSEQGEFRGWVTVRGFLAKKPQRLYVVLQEAVIYCFKDDSMKSATGKVSLGPAWDVKPVAQDKKEAAKVGQQWTLRLAAPADKKKDLVEVFLTFTNGEESDCWLAAISFAIMYKSPRAYRMPLAVDFAKSDVARCPWVIHRLVEFIEAHDGITQSGIFRISGMHLQVQKLVEAFDTGVPANVEAFLADLGDVNVATNALKTYVRELPEPLLTFERYKQFVDAGQDAAKLAELVKGLPRPNRLTLHYIMEHLVRVAAKSDVNMMTPQNLAIVFGPTILRASESEAQAAAADSDRVNAVCAAMIALFPEVFADIAKEAAAAKPRVRAPPLVPDDVPDGLIESDDESKDKKKKEKEDKEKREREEKEQAKREKKLEKERRKAGSNSEEVSKGSVGSIPGQLSQSSDVQSSPVLAGSSGELSVSTPPEIRTSPRPASPRPNSTGMSTLLMEERISALEARMAAMEANYQKQIEALQAEIAELRH
eukprot:m51a1_g876 putative domain containing protein (481) ;mRNA; f:870306-872635